MFDYNNLLVDLLVASATYGLLFVKFKPRVKDSPQRHKNAFIKEVRGHWMQDYVTVTYGKRDDNGQIQDYSKIVCIKIPKHFPDANVANGPLQQIISPLPNRWEDYLLKQPEAKM